MLQIGHQISPDATGRIQKLIADVAPYHAASIGIAFYERIQRVYAPTAGVILPLATREN
jgi:hypothetical protein